MLDDVDLILMVGGDLHALGGKQHDIPKAAAEMVGKGRVQFNLVLGQDQGQRTLAQAGGLAIEKGRQAGITHGGSEAVWRQGRRSGGAMQDVAAVGFKVACGARRGQGVCQSVVSWFGRSACPVR